jgi:hypothetical protein
MNNIKFKDFYNINDIEYGDILILKRKKIDKDRIVIVSNEKNLIDLESGFNITHEYITHNYKDISEYIIKIYRNPEIIINGRKDY